MNIKKVTVIGAGIMGSQIAMQAAIHGFSVVCYDIKKEMLQKAEEYVLEKGLAGITLATNRYVPAPAFYKKNGYFECEHVLYMGKAIQPNPDQQTS